MRKSRSQQTTSLNTELNRNVSEKFPDKGLLDRLEEVIERFLPGDFSSWEDDHSRWSGDRKIIDGTRRNPNSRSSAFSIYTAHEYGEEIFGFADQSKDEAALLQLEQALAQCLEALRNISVWTQLSLAKASFEKMSGFVKAPAHLVLPACAAALQDGIEAARQNVASKGTPRNKESRRAAAVVGECREIYTARGYGPAPRWVRKEGAIELSSEFGLFTKAVFDVLGIRVRVDSAFRVWRKVSEMSEVSRGQQTDAED